MAKYKEERRRQLASQIANRLSSNQSSSSSDEAEDSNSSSLEKFAKYRRHHRSKQKEGGASTAAPVVEDATPPVVTRRRRRRSVTKESASPARSPRVQRKMVVNVNEDADGEDDDDREESPEHIYHQIGTDQVIRVKKNAPPEKKDPILITKNTASRQPRLPLPLPAAASSSSKDKPSNPPTEPGDLTKTKHETALAETLTTANEKRKSMLNTSYSSEEILLQAASSLQGLEGIIKDILGIRFVYRNRLILMPYEKCNEAAVFGGCSLLNLEAIRRKQIVFVFHGSTQEKIPFLIFRFIENGGICNPLNIFKIVREIQYSKFILFNLWKFHIFFCCQIFYKGILAGNSKCCTVFKPKFAINFCT